MTRIRYVLAGILALSVGCATLREAAALRSVEFHFDSVSDARVARVRLDRIRSYHDLTAADVARLGIAVASKDVPLELTVHVQGRNPETNRVTARLIALDWTYVVDGQDLLAGTLDRAIQFPPGEPVDVPIVLQLNLVRFFQGGARDQLETALSLAGYGAQTHSVVLRVSPTIDTALGPIRYPTPISISIASPR
jgi:hypothetical protein